MARKREWFKHDAWFLADDKIRRLGHKFGAQGPLVAEALLELAKRQKTAGDVEVDWSYLAEHAFVKGAPRAARRAAREIIEACEQVGLIEVAEVDEEGVRLTLPKWRQIQGGGVPGSERTANWRARKASESDEDVTSHDRHCDEDVTRSSRAVAKEAEKIEGAKAPSSGADRADREMGKASEEDRANLRSFIKLGRDRNPKMKVPAAGTNTLGDWFSQMRLLRERDGNAADEIASVIQWLFTDPGKDANFWGSTVAAPSGLREHYPQIWAKMKAQGNGHKSPSVESSADFLARRGAQ